MKKNGLPPRNILEDEPEIEEIGLENLQGPASKNLLEDVHQILFSLTLDIGQIPQSTERDPHVQIQGDNVEIEIPYQEDPVTKYLKLSFVASSPVSPATRFTESPTIPVGGRPNIQLGVTTNSGAPNYASIIFEKPLPNSTKLIERSWVEINEGNEVMTPKDRLLTSVSKPGEPPKLRSVIEFEAGIRRTDLLDLLKRIWEAPFFPDETRNDAKKAFHDELEREEKNVNAYHNLFHAEGTIREQEDKIDTLQSESFTLARSLRRWRIASVLSLLLGISGGALTTAAGKGIDVSRWSSNLEDLTEKVTTMTKSITDNNTPSGETNDEKTEETEEAEQVQSSPLRNAFLANGIKGTLEPVNPEKALPEGGNGWLIGINLYRDHEDAGSQIEHQEMRLTTRPINVSDGILPATFADFDPRRRDMLLIMDDTGNVYRYHFQFNVREDMPITPEDRFKTKYWNDEPVLLLLEDKVALSYRINDDGEIGAGFLADLKTLSEKHPGSNPRVISQAHYKEDSTDDRDLKAVTAQKLIAELGFKG